MDHRPNLVAPLQLSPQCCPAGFHHGKTPLESKLHSRIASAVAGQEPGREPRPRMRATYHRTEGVRHLLAAYELGEDKLFGHVKPSKTRTRFLEFCRYLRSLYPPEVRIAIVCDNFSPHLSTRRDARVGIWATANNVEFAYTPTNSSWLNRIEAQFTALRYFALDGTDHASHQEQASMIRRYIICPTTTPTTNDSAASSTRQTLLEAALARNTCICRLGCVADEYVADSLIRRRLPGWDGALQTRTVERSLGLRA
jgi:transposase